MAQMIQVNKADVAAGKISDEGTFLSDIVSKSEELQKQGKTIIDGVRFSSGLSTDELMGSLPQFSGP